MIVANSNLIAYLHLPGPMSTIAERVLSKDPVWCTPPLWKSEFRSILFSYMRTQNMDLSTAQIHWQNAISHLGAHQCEVDSTRVLELARSSKLSAYDAEYVMLAEQLGVSLLTSDKQIIHEFPKLAMTPQIFLKERG